jgi:nitrogen fixation protein NifB
MNASIDPRSVKHPCFNKEASGSCGRVHLPVAPKCNIHAITATGSTTA